MGVTLTSFPLRVLGVGSPFGDDQLGWNFVRTLGAEFPTVQTRILRQPIELLDHLGDCRKLVIVDACHSGVCCGEITRLVWPDARILECHAQSTHGFSIADSLRLAQQLRRLPGRVVLWGLGISSVTLDQELSPPVASGMARLRREIVRELSDDQIGPELG